MKVKFFDCLLCERYHPKAIEASSRWVDCLAVVFLVFVLYPTSDLLAYSRVNTLVSDNSFINFKNRMNVQTSSQTYIVEFHLAGLSPQNYADLKESHREAILDQLIQSVERDTNLILDIRSRYHFIPAVVIMLDDIGLQQLKLHSAVKSVSLNDRLNAI